MNTHSLILLLIFGLVTGCEPVTSQSDQIRPEEYAVLSAVIDTFYATGNLNFHRPAVVLLTEYTCLPPESERGIRSKWPYVVYKPGWPDPDGFVFMKNDSREVMINALQSDLPELNWSSLLQDFDSVGIRSVRLDSSCFSLSQHVRMVSAQVLREDSSERSGFASPFQEDDAGGLVSVSRVGLNQTRNQAIVYYHEDTDGSGSMYFVLHKEGSRWIVLRGRGWGNL